MADPVHKIKTIAIKDYGVAGVRLAGAHAVSAGRCRLPPPRFAARRAVRRLLAEAPAAGEALVSGDGNARHPRHRRGFLSAEAIADPPPFERARAAVVYSGVARRMVQGPKYQDRTNLAPWMARWMMRAGAELIAEADMVVPVPLHWRRCFRRQFNGSAELARAVSKLRGLPFFAGGGETRQARSPAGRAGAA